jgi:hypothetical protein
LTQKTSAIAKSFKNKLLTDLTGLCIKVIIVHHQCNCYPVISIYVGKLLSAPRPAILTEIVVVFLSQSNLLPVNASKYTMIASLTIL